MTVTITAMRAPLGHWYLRGCMVRRLRCSARRTDFRGAHGSYRHRLREASASSGRACSGFAKIAASRRHRIPGVRMSRLMALACLAAAFVFGGPALAQDYPNKPLRLVVGFPPGGSADVMGRLIAQKLAEQMGQQVIVDNKPGAGSMVGNEFVAKQPADGHTLLLVTGAYPVQAAMLKQLPIDPVKDIAMVSTVTTYPFVVNVRPD